MRQTEMRRMAKIRKKFPEIIFTDNIFSVHFEVDDMIGSDLKENVSFHFHFKVILVISFPKHLRKVNMPLIVKNVMKRSFLFYTLIARLIIQLL
jgi:hypothetical protein